MATKVKKEKLMKIETPYPEKGDKKNDLPDINFIGDELVKLSNRLNEIELSFHDMDVKLKQIAGRMGL
tara:strand:+ start:162 stop:365 length:204 start_codon:yes stop_codon:yes gene_type:complete